MRVLVSDSSVLIELDMHGSIELMFQLPYQFAIPDFLYHDELQRLESCTLEQLVEMGLRVECLEDEGMEKLGYFQSKAPGLSLPDCSALALAALNQYTLLTGDKLMRNTAQREGIKFHGTLWVLDEMVSYGVLDKPACCTILRNLMTDPQCRLPRKELKARISNLSIG